MAGEPFTLCLGHTFSVTVDVPNDLRWEIQFSADAMQERGLLIAAEKLEPVVQSVPLFNAAEEGDIEHD
jgi:hypothetical protein